MRTDRELVLELAKRLGLKPTSDPTARWYCDHVTILPFEIILGAGPRGCSDHNMVFEFDDDGKLTGHYA